MKDIAHHIGFNWSDENASGRQSLVWRTRWEISQNDEFKQKLITYNLEDCIALRQITDFIYKVINTDDIVPTKFENSNIMWTKDIQNETSYRVSKPKFFFHNFDIINKKAYFEYQREKIFIRTSKKIKKIQRKTINSKKARFRINQIVIIRKPYKCYTCKSAKIVKEKICNPKTVIDLRFTNYGVKRWVVQYKTFRYRCLDCGRINTPKTFKYLKKYGHNLACWVVYHIIENGTSEDRMIKNIYEIFGIPLSKVKLALFKVYAADYYQSTYKMILRKLVLGLLLHSDETKIKLKTNEGYVWILTNMEVVLFPYKNTREVGFLKKLLMDFQGVLVTDFFMGYDSLSCTQQKCLIHLIRDLNHYLYKNPFNDEFKEMVEKFGILLRTVVETIDKFGLKKRLLNKHNKDVEIYYTFLRRKKYTSDLARKYKKRFERNRNKLFTFLHYDGVQWNNNNAENAIRHFATYRKIVDGMMTENGLSQYLVLLSIYQTYKFQKINFLNFLLYGKKDIEKYKP